MNAVNFKQMPFKEIIKGLTLKVKVVFALTRISIQAVFQNTHEINLRMVYLQLTLHIKIEPNNITERFYFP